MTFAEGSGLKKPNSAKMNQIKQLEIFMRLNFSAILPSAIASHESIVLPISMNQVLERGERLAAIINSIYTHQYQDRVTILLCDYLNRHNCLNDEDALLQGDIFLKEHHHLLDGLKILRWQDFLNSREPNIFTARFDEIITKSQHHSNFYLKMKKTWEKCLSATQSLEASIQYQMEEYAAVLCMQEFDHLFYPKRISNGLAYVYNHFSVKIPKYHHIKISEIKTVSKNELFANLHALSSYKEMQHVHIAFRGLLENMSVLLASHELSDKAKYVFAQEAENILLMHGLMDKNTENLIQHS